MASSTVSAVTQSPPPPPVPAALPLPPAAPPRLPAPPAAEPGVTTRFSGTCRAEQQASLRCQVAGMDRSSRLEACVVFVDAYKRCMEEARKQRLAENNRNTGGDGSVSAFLGKR